MPTEPLNLLVWWDPKSRWSYAGGIAGMSCGILVVTDDSIAFASSRGVEFLLPRVGLQSKWRLTMGCVLMHGGREYLVYLHPPVAACRPLSQHEADRISATYLGTMRAVTIPAESKSEVVLSSIGVALGSMAGKRNGSDIGLLAAAFKARHYRRALKARLG